MRFLPRLLAVLAVLVTTGVTLGLISLLRAAVGLLIGVVMGLVLNRVQRLAWSEEGRLVTFTFDALSVLMLIFFALLVTLRAFLALSRSDGLLEAAVIGMSTTLGVMFVRLRHLKEVAAIAAALAQR